MQTDPARPWRTPRVVVLGLLAAATGISCMQPSQSAQDFGTGEASTVTGASYDDDQNAEEEPGEDEDKDDEDDDRASAAADEDDVTDASDVEDGEDDEGEGEGDVTNARDGGRSAADASSTDTMIADARDADMSEGPELDAGASEPVGPAPTELSFTVTTAGNGGRYAPRHILAIWVVDGNGKFVKTLAKYAFIRARYLTGWNAASAGNVVDAVTGATLASHAQRSVTWNLKDATRKVVPDGDYKLVAELTDADRTGVSVTVPFAKGNSPVQLEPADTSSFKNMSLILK